ncbi:MAG: HmuY family protein [Bacteroidota bacterium]
MHRYAFLLLFASLVLTACDSDDTADEAEPLAVETVNSIEADPATIPPGGGRPVATGRYTLYSLEDGRVVLSSSEADPAVRERDSVSTAWDVGFRSTTVIFNGGSSGPGNAAATILAEAFDDVTEAPATLLADGNNQCPEIQGFGGVRPGPPLAVCTGSGNGWYNYDPAANVVSPRAGRTIVFRTADEQLFGKMRILSYYQGNPSAPTSDNASRYYTFEYVLQPDGSREF